jgi:hypothetical protein
MWDCIQAESLGGKKLNPSKLFGSPAMTSPLFFWGFDSPFIL